MAEEKSKKPAPFELDDLMPDLVRLGAYYIEAGAADFKTFSDEWVEEYGENVRPHLRRIYAESRELFEREQQDEQQREVETVDDSKPNSAISTINERVARASRTSEAHTPTDSQPAITGIDGGSFGVAESTGPEIATDRQPTATRRSETQPIVDSRRLVTRRRIAIGILIGLAIIGLAIGSYYLGASRTPASYHPIIGNRRTRIYHWYGCPNYYDIAPENQVIFTTLEQAEARRFRPAENCSSPPPRSTVR